MPVTIIGDRVWIGFDSTIAQEITAVVDRRRQQRPRPCADGGACPLAGGPDHRRGRPRRHLAAGQHPRDRLRRRGQPLLALGPQPAAGDGAQPRLPWTGPAGRDGLPQRDCWDVRALHGRHVLRRVVPVRHGLAASRGRRGRGDLRRPAVQGRSRDHRRALAVDLGRAATGHLRPHASSRLARGRAGRHDRRDGGPRDRRVTARDTMHRWSAPAVDDDAGRSRESAPLRPSGCSPRTCSSSCSTSSSSSCSPS